MEPKTEPILQQNPEASALLPVNASQLIVITSLITTDTFNR